MKLFKKRFGFTAAGSQKDDTPSRIQENIYRQVEAASESAEFQENNVNLWDSVASKLDIQLMKPKRKNDDAYEITEEIKKGETFFFIKNISNAVYLSLNEEEYFVWSLLDGETTIKEICTTYFLKYKKLSNMPVKLIQLLLKKNMLTEEWWDIYVTLYRKQRKGFRYNFRRMSRFFLNCKLSFPRTDKVFQFLYRTVGWILLRKEALVVYGLLIISGLTVFLGMDYFSQRHSLKNFVTQEFSVFLLLMAAILPVVLHEFAHAFTCLKYGRRVNRAGIMLYIGLPMLFVETTDIWMRPKKERIFVSLAGPFTDLLVGSTCFLLHKIFGNHGLLQLLPVVGLIAFIRCLYNFNPLLEFDGYYILMDLLEIPELRKKAFNFITKGGLKKLVTRQKMTREEYILLIYGAIAGIYTYWMVLFMIYIWQNKIRNIFAELWNTNHGSIISVALIIAGGLFVLVRLLFMLKLLYTRIEPFLNRLFSSLSVGLKKTGNSR